MSSFTTQQDSSPMSFKFSANEDEQQLNRDATALTRQGGGRWRITEEGTGLERTFHFKTFRATWDFMNTVATECKSQKHHPEWTNIFNKTKVRWTTHRPVGLSSKDVVMARFCDEAGVKHGEVESVEDEDGDGCGCGEFKS